MSRLFDLLIINSRGTYQETWDATVKLILKVCFNLSFIMDFDLLAVDTPVDEFATSDRANADQLSNYTPELYLLPILNVAVLVFSC